MNKDKEVVLQVLQAVVHTEVGLEAQWMKDQLVQLAQIKVAHTEVGHPVRQEVGHTGVAPDLQLKMS